MADLSPAAQAVLDATGVRGTTLELPARGIAVAALRAVATAIGAQELIHPDSKRTEGVKLCVRNIYAIAAELEALND